MVLRTRATPRQGVQGKPSRVRALDALTNQPIERAQVGLGGRVPVRWKADSRNADLFRFSSIADLRDDPLLIARVTADGYFSKERRVSELWVGAKIEGGTWVV